MSRAALPLRRSAFPLLGPRLERITAGDRFLPAEDPPDLRGYIELALSGGFPEPAFGLPPGKSDRWYRSHAEHLVRRDPPGGANGRDPERLRRFLVACALNAAGVVSENTLHRAAGINRRTGIAYRGFLEALGVVHALPAWASNRLKRLLRMPKLCFVDTGLMGAVARADVETVLGDGNLLGRVLETFVLAQLRAEAAASEAPPPLYHLRQEQGRREVDILVEVEPDRVAGIEVKATSAPRPRDARHLRWLRDELGDRFVGGVVFHTGPHCLPLGERIVAAPICALWA